jgi:type I restriction enzyme R subunit
LFFDQVRESAVANEQLRQAAMINTKENFGLVFLKLMDNLFVDRMDGNEDIFVRVMNDESFKQIVADSLARTVYQQIRGSGAAGLN